MNTSFSPRRFSPLTAAWTGANCTSTSSSATPKDRHALSERRGEVDVILAPRGAAKSTLVSLILPIHALLYETEGFIVLLSRRCARHQAAFKHQERPAERWAAQRPFRRTAEPADASLRALDRTGRPAPGSLFRRHRAARDQLRPWRPTWIILDDVERSERTRVAQHREALADWFREVVENLGDRSTNIDLIGTLLHRDALPARLLERPDVTGKTFRSILDEAARADLWDAWRARLNNFEDPSACATPVNFIIRTSEMLEGSRCCGGQGDISPAAPARKGRAGAFDKEKQTSPGPTAPRSSPRAPAPLHARGRAPRLRADGARPFRRRARRQRTAPNRAR